MILLFAIFSLSDWGFYSGFGLLGFWQATALKYKSFGSYADGKCSVCVLSFMMGFRLSITRGKTANSYFLCPLLTYLSKTAVVTHRAEGFLVWVGSGAWNLKEKVSVDT